MKENSLTKVNPKLAQEWHPTANGVITPNEVTAHCNKKYVWLCNRGHSFEASPENRLRGAGCPYCSGRRLLVGFNDLQTVCPKIINEWDFDNNKLLPNEITYNTTKRANWVCAKCGNKWNAPIRNRTKNNKTGCPKCAVINRGLKKHLSALEHNGHIDKELLLKEWDYEKNKLVPENYTKASNKEVFWICSKCGYSFKAKISNRYYRKGGCPCCSNKVIVVGVNDLATTHPRLAKEWDYERNGNLLPQDVTYGRANKVWWKCPEGHSYKATVLHRASGGTNCPKCVSGRQTSFAEQALFFYVKKLYPDAINRYTDIFPKGMELDVFIPSIRLGIEYDGEAWHKKDKRDREKKKYQICQKYNIKLLRLKEKMDDSCRGTADEFIQKDNMYEPRNLAQVIQAVLNSIDPETNAWTRSNPTRNVSKVMVDISRDEMEIRQYMTNLKGISLAEKFPEIASEWHPTLNGTVTPSKVKPMSDVKYYWLCPECGNEYRSSVGHRVYGTGCPKCAIKNNALAKSKAIVMIDQNTGEVLKEFISISEASRQTGVSSSNITSACKGNRRIAGGYIWRYSNSILP